MSSKSLPKVKAPIETNHQLLQVIKSSLDKLSNPHTVDIGLAELKEIMQAHINSATRMNTLITIITEQNEHMTTSHKKETFKAYSLMGEIFGESMLAFFPKIFPSCETKWEDPNLHVSLSDNLGIMIHHVFKQVANIEEQVAHLGNLIENLLDTVKNTKQNVQIGAAMCLTRVIQNGPVDAIIKLLPNLSDHLVDLFNTPNIKCTGQLLEILISLILSVELSFEPFVPKFIPILLDNMASKQEWSIRKLAIDVIYTLSAFLPQSLESHVDSIINLLKEAKTDKSKHVREAAHEALIKLKDAKTKDGKQLFSTPIRDSAKKQEEQKNTPETHKSLLENPINTKFMEAAPKSSIEILTVGPLRNFEDNKNNTPTKENILDELKQEIEKEEAEKSLENKEEDIKVQNEEKSQKPDENLQKPDENFQILSENPKETPKTPEKPTENIEIKNVENETENKPKTEEKKQENIEIKKEENLNEKQEEVNKNILEIPKIEETKKEQEKKPEEIISENSKKEEKVPENQPEIKKPDSISKSEEQKIQIKPIQKQPEVAPSAIIGLQLSIDKIAKVFFIKTPRK